MAEYDFLYDLPRVDFNGRGLHILPRVQYGRVHPRQFMECIYKDGLKKRPALLWVHGGGWQDENLTPSYRPEETLAWLAERGFFVACIEYRLAQHAKFPACVEDCQRAVKYLREHAERLGIDGDRIGVWGESAGAHIAAMTALNFNEDPGAAVQSAVLWFCPSDLVLQEGEDGAIVSGLLGCDPRQYPERARAASPVSYAANPKPPMLLLHGDADELVSYEQSVRFVWQLQAHGGRAKLVTVPGQGHGFFRGQQYYDCVTDFLLETLGGK